MVRCYYWHAKTTKYKVNWLQGQKHSFGLSADIGIKALF